MMLIKCFIIATLIFAGIESVSNKDFVLKPIQNQNGKWGYVNESGRCMIPPVFDEAYNFCDNLARVKTCGKYGYINKNGKYVISAKFINARDFSDCLAAVMVIEKGRNLWGYINTNGCFVICPQFTTAGDFSAGLANVKINGNEYLINDWGEVRKIIKGH